MSNMSAEIKRIPEDKLAGLTEDRFWELVKMTNWPNDGYNEPHIKYLRTLSPEEGRKFRSAVDRVWGMVDNFIGSDRNPAGGGDDSHSDFIFHIIGLGKKEFYAHMNDYKLMKKRGIAYDYEESFGYAVPYKDEWDNPEREADKLQADLDRRAKKKEMKVKAKEKGKELISADEVIRQIAEVLSENDGEFIENIANQVLSHKVNYVEDSMFEIETIGEARIEDPIEE